MHDDEFARTNSNKKLYTSKLTNERPFSKCYPSPNYYGSWHIDGEE